MEEEKEKLKQDIKRELKKEMIKQQIIFIVCIVIIGIVIFAINRPKEINYKNDNNTSSYSQDSEDKRLTMEELEQYKIDKVEITTENWKEYITTEDKTKEEKDEFGELKTIKKESGIKIKDNYCGYAVLRFEAVNSNNYYVAGVKGGNTTTTLYGGTDYYCSSYDITKVNSSSKNGNIEIYDDTFTIDDLKCIKAKGYIYKLDVPEEYWNENKTGIKVYRENGSIDTMDIRTISQKEYKDRENIKE